MKKIFLLLFLFATISSCDKSKSSYEIYKQKAATIYSMSSEEEAIKMQNVNGCYGLILGKTTPSKAKKILKDIISDFKGPFNHDYSSKKDYKYISLPCKNITYYSATITHTFDSHTYIYMHFVNDTLSQIQLSFAIDNFDLEKELVSKYGQGNGEKKDTEFGINKNGRINFNDVTRGHEFRRWQNNDISIDWHQDKYLTDISNSRHYKSYASSSKGINNTVFYTSKKMAKRIIYYLDLSYSQLINKENNDKTSTLNNL